MKIFGSGKSLLVRAIAFGLIGVGASALADLSPIVFSVSASNSNGSGSWEVAYEPGNDGPDGYFWSGGAQVITDGEGDEIAVVELASFSAFGDPAVGMTFTVQALAANTTFAISSGILSFPALNAATGIASAGLTVTDSDSNAFAALAGNIGAMGTSSFVASYNGGTIHSEDIGPLSVNNVAGSDSDNFNSGMLPIGSVNSIKVDFGFTLSANDSASGTSVFFVVPEPSSLALIGLGAIAMLRRR